MLVDWAPTTKDFKVETLPMKELTYERLVEETVRKLRKKYEGKSHTEVIGFAVHCTECGCYRDGILHIQHVKPGGFYGGDGGWIEIYTCEECGSLLQSYSHGVRNIIKTKPNELQKSKNRIREIQG